MTEKRLETIIKEKKIFDLFLNVDVVKESPVKVTFTESEEKILRRYDCYEMVCTYLNRVTTKELSSAERYSSRELVKKMLGAIEDNYDPEVDFSEFKEKLSKYDILGN